MSIAFPLTESGSTLDPLREHDGNAATRPTSAARVAANRRNAQRSTGPRTDAGKRRSSRNAMKHGLCRTLSCLPSECEATFMTFVDELREELQPATAMQRLAFNQIASLHLAAGAAARSAEQDLSAGAGEGRGDRRGRRGWAVAVGRAGAGVQ